MNTNEKYSDEIIAELKVCVGDQSEITELPDGFKVKTILTETKSEGRPTIEGGQEIELVIGTRKTIPIDLTPYGYELSGLPLKSLTINGIIVEGFNFFISPKDQNGTYISSSNFADAESNSVVVSSLKSSESLLILAHEIGHVKSGHGLTNRVKLIQDLNEKVYSKYVDYEQGKIDTASLKEDKEAMDAIMSVFNQEEQGCNEGIKFLLNLEKVFPNDTNLTNAALYLDQEIKLQYIEVYGL